MPIDEIHEEIRFDDDDQDKESVLTCDYCGSNYRPVYTIVDLPQDGGSHDN